MGIIHRVAIDVVAMGVGEPVEDVVASAAYECVAAEIDRIVIEIVVGHKIADRAVTDRAENGVKTAGRIRRQIVVNGETELTCIEAPSVRVYEDIARGVIDIDFVDRSASRMAGEIICEPRAENC